jgi:hypothetical protein
MLKLIKIIKIKISKRLAKVAPAGLGKGTVIYLVKVWSELFAI